MPKKEFIPLGEMPESATKGSDLTPEEELLLKELEVRGELTPEQEEAFERTLTAGEHVAKQPRPAKKTIPKGAPIPHKAFESET